MQAVENGSHAYAITVGQLVSMNTGRNLGLERLRKSRSERRVRSATIVVRHPLPQNAADGRLADRSYPVQTFPADRSDQPLAESVRLWSANRRFEDMDTQILNRRIQSFGKDRISVVNHELIGMIEAEKFSKLVKCPIGGWVRRDVEMDNSARTCLHGDENVQDPERDRDGYEEITRHDGLGMIQNESPPALIRNAARAVPVQVLRNSSRRHLYPELQQQLIGNSLLTPCRILSIHLATCGCFSAALVDPRDATSIARRHGRPPDASARTYWVYDDQCVNARVSVS